jgi:hypothetical protein
MTLLRLMFDSHPALAIPPETHFIPAIAATCAEHDRGCFLKLIAEHPRWHDFRLDLAALRAAIGSLPAFDLSAGLRAFYQLYAQQHGKVRWGDKTPRYVEHMRVVKKILPEAHFIHMIRDGRDVALSIMPLSFGPNTIEAAARWWVSRITRARAQAADVRDYLEVRYEELLVRPDECLRKSCDFVGLPFDERMLGYHERAESRLAEVADLGATSARERRQIHAKLLERPDPLRVGRWKREMARRERQRFEAIAGALLHELGYEA